MNELLWLLFLFVNFGFVLFAFWFFGREGLFVWVAVAAILANIQVLKTVELFGFVATLGNIIYGSSFLVTDILNEFYGPKEARKAVWIGFFTLISSVVIMQIALLFVPHSSDFIQGALVSIFSFLPRVAFASVVAYIISQMHDVWAYNFWRNIFPYPHQIWIRNNFSTMVSQLIDSVLICVLAFVGVFPAEVFRSRLLTTYFLKWLVAAADTPFIYLARFIYLKKVKKEPEKGPVR